MIPIEFPVSAGSHLIFAGRRWHVDAIDQPGKVIELSRAVGGSPPKFGTPGPEIADGIRAKMRSLYLSDTVPAYLSATARQLVAEGREAFRRMGLDRSAIYASGNETILIPWRGDRILDTLLVVLSRAGIEVTLESAAIHCRIDLPSLTRIIATLARSPEPDPLALARDVAIKEQDKHDDILGSELLTAAYAARSLDVPGAWKTLRDIAVHL
jgi:ATP-dependent Lhr-like helicase